MCSIVNRVPILLVGALFFFCMQGLAGGESLPERLYKEGDWINARREALRLQGSRPPAPDLFYLLSAHRLNPTDETLSAKVGEHIKQLPVADARAWAAYELGRSLWAQGNVTSAYVLLKQSFQSAPDARSFFLSGGSLQYLLAQHPDLAPKEDSIRIQLRTIRGRIPPALRDEARPPPVVRRTPWLLRPFGLGIAFYQTQIGPAIGHRCSMHPSCSRYAHEAIQTQGVIGIPMMADRLIRESDHVTQRIRPVYIDGMEKYEDPVSDHAGRWSKQ